ncbi:hypothetical protein OHT68_47700 [Streptomyces canus]|uniref:hypothetical protein n=1 Tax=Streptomyces canus TaxID=58343 RepID=UPI002E2D89C1|nr:hypothetical protein [Streptomyces canus]
MVDERFTAGGQIVAVNEVQRLQADVDSAVEAPLTVHQNKRSSADSFLVVRPQRQIRGPGHGDTGSRLCMPQFLAEARLVLVSAEVAARVEGGWGRPRPAAPLFMADVFTGCATWRS